MSPRRVPVFVQVAIVTVVTSLVLGGVVTGLIESLGEGGRTAGDMLRQWGVWSAVSSPVAFVFGAVAFVIGRAVWRKGPRTANHGPQ